MIVPINKSNAEHAAALLARGFPRYSESFWQASVARLVNFEGNKIADVPVGHLMLANDKPSGVVLTPASCRRNEDGTLRRLINVSCWYVEPDQRWRAPMLIRSVLTDENATYTDLSSEHKTILEAFDFVPINEGQAIIFTPYSTLFHGGSGHVVSLDSVPADVIEPPLADVLEEHLQLGCLGAALVLEDDRVLPLFFKTRLKFGLTVADLVYSESNTALQNNLGPVARFLLRRGQLLLRMDIPKSSRVQGIEFRNRGMKYARGAIAKDKTDYMGTEYSLFDY